MGDSGIQGAQGIQGPAGAVGPQGPIGASGPSAIVSSPALLGELVGTYYLYSFDQNNSLFWQGQLVFDALGNVLPSTMTGVGYYNPTVQVGPVSVTGSFTLNPDAIPAQAMVSTYLINVASDGNFLRWRLVLTIDQTRTSVSGLLYYTNNTSVGFGTVAGVRVQ